MLAWFDKMDDSRRKFYPFDTRLICPARAAFSFFLKFVDVIFSRAELTSLYLVPRRISLIWRISTYYHCCTSLSSNNLQPKGPKQKYKTIRCTNSYRKYGGYWYKVYTSPICSRRFSALFPSSLQSKNAYKDTGPPPRGDHDTKATRAILQLVRLICLF